MSIRLNVSPSLSYYTDKRESFEVNGKTVSECLVCLTGQYHDLKKVLYTKDDKLVSLVDVYINKEDIVLQDLSRPVADGDELSVVFPVGG